MIFGIILFVIIIGAMIGGGIYAYKIVNQDSSSAMENNNKKGNKNIQNNSGSKVKNTKEFLPFKDLKGGIIDLGNHKYRAVIQVGSLNYALRTSQEQERVDISYQSFLNSLNHPITIYIHTRNLDNRKVLENLSKDLEHITGEFSHLNDYANMYYEEMKDIHKRINNNKQKTKYIIVPFEDVEELNQLNEEEKFNYVKKELRNRCSNLVGSFNNMDIEANVLNQGELIEFLYSVFHRENYLSSEHLISGEYTESFVKGENKLNSLSNNELLQTFLYDTQNKIVDNLLNKKLEEDEDAFIGAIIEYLSELREQSEDYYQKEE